MEGAGLAHTYARDVRDGEEDERRELLALRFVRVHQVLPPAVPSRVDAHLPVFFCPRPYRSARSSGRTT